MINILIREAGFNKRAAQTFAPIFKDIYDFAKLGNDAILSEEEEIPESNGNEGKMNRIPPPSDSKIKETSTILIGGGEAVLRVPDPLSEEDYEYIKTWLDFLKPALVSSTKNIKKVDNND